MLNIRKLIITTVISLVAFQISNAQFGITYSYSKSNPENWQNIVNQYRSEADLFDSGWAVGLNYWFRLKNYRWEFYPEVSYRSNSSDFSVAENTEMLGLDFYQFQVHSQVYIFDIEGDCNCPTFSKDGNFFTKGFFVSISPGLGIARQHYEFNNSFTMTNILQSEHDFNYHLGIGAGIDIGLTDLITVTPLFQWKKYFSLDWENFETLFNQLSENENNSANLSEMNFGLRLGIRLDYDN